MRSVGKASAIAAAICIVLAVVLRVLEAGLPLRPQQGPETVISVAAVLMVTYMTVWMRAFPKDHLSGWPRAGVVRAEIRLCVDPLVRAMQKRPLHGDR